MRRGVPSNRRFVAGAAPVRWEPSDAGASLLSWMRGSDPGASINTTPDPDEYESIPDQGSVGGQFVAPDAGSRPQVSTLWTPGPAPLFSGGRRLIHSVSAAAFAALSDGTTDVRGGIVFRADGAVVTSFYLATFNGGTTNTGFTLHGGSNGTARLTVGNSSGTLALNLSAAGLSAGARHILTWDKVGAVVSLRVDRVQVASGTISSPDAGAPQHTLTMGASASGSVPTVGWIPESLIFAGSDLPSLYDIESWLDANFYTP